MGLAGIEQDTLGRCGFTSVNMGNNADIPVPLQRMLTRHDYKLSNLNMPEN
jgi:hypothetical protein